jgi:trans-aconitate methyltransferase
MTRATPSIPSEFTALTCSAPEERAARMAELVLRHAPAGPIRLLDLGCGTGGLLFRLASALPSATCVGIDISLANIKVAEAALQGRPDRDRLAVEAADYLEWQTPPVDVIAIDGVLHLIPHEIDALAAKLAHDVKPGGVIVNSMPYECVYNMLFKTARQVLRATRSSWTDAAILAVGRKLHPEMTVPLLRERVHYMYLPPMHVMGPRLEAVFSAHGLFAIARYPVRSTSLAQLRHSVTVWKKNG